MKVEDSLYRMVYEHARLFPEGFMVLQNFVVGNKSAHLPYLQHPVFAELPMEQTLDAMSNEPCRGSIKVYRKSVKEALAELVKFYF